ncbi:putative diphthamide synthesis protein-domain-containing protein [Auriculariales sp. MPI-PUGE-AT-0066]|nr:putative diphthamide synthesis protein-domain-containing protein [Auriculariales sp. MPI-PUGE-AT-0066]
MASTSAFSTAAEVAIERAVELNLAGTSLVTTSTVDQHNLVQIYELDQIARELADRSFKRITLQFPDELLHDSVPVFRELQRRLAKDVELYVLADTTYGSCCVDEVAAQHVDGDVVVHFGHACLSRTSRLPVLYVFGRREIDAQHCISALVDSCEQKPAHVRLLYDVAYAHAAEALRDILQAELPNATTDWSSPPDRFWLPQAQSLELPEESSSDDAPLLVESQPENTVIFYVGAESLALSTVLMTHALVKTYSYDPTTRTARSESSRTNSILARRYALVHKARRADVFGIVVGTLGIASYLPVIAHLRRALARAGKKTYTLAVGKLNPAKLGNFPDIGCFVLVACPQTSIVDSRDYMSPVVTPFELLRALAPGEPVWTGDYELDFGRLLQMPVRSADTDDEDADEDAPQFDFTTGKLRSLRRFERTATETVSGTGGENTAEGALVRRNEETALATGVYGVGAEFLNNRMFKGLEVNAGRDTPAILEQGRSGIARGYTNAAIVDDRDTS